MLNPLTLFPYLYFYPVAWSLNLFGLILHRILSLVFYFSFTLNIVLPKGLGYILFLALGSVFYPVTTSRTSESDILP
jgi:hypothetical protein